MESDPSSREKGGSNGFLRFIATRFVMENKDLLRFLRYAWPDLFMSFFCRFNFSVMATSSV